MPLLGFRNLKKMYRTPEGGKLTVLDVPEFALEERQQPVLRGASGTGKTTFLNCIAGILRPDNGSVLLNGTDMDAASAFPMKPLAPVISIVPTSGSFQNRFASYGPAHFMTTPTMSFLSPLLILENISGDSV